MVPFPLRGRTTAAVRWRNDEAGSFVARPPSTFLSRRFSMMCGAWPHNLSGAGKQRGLGGRVRAYPLARFPLFRPSSNRPRELCGILKRLSSNSKKYIYVYLHFRFHFLLRILKNSEIEIVIRLQSCNRINN